MFPSLFPPFPPFFLINIQNSFKLQNNPLLLINNKPITAIKNLTWHLNSSHAVITSLPLGLSPHFQFNSFDTLSVQIPGLHSHPDPDLICPSLFHFYLALTLIPRPLWIPSLLILWLPSHAYPFIGPLFTELADVPGTTTGKETQQ